MGERRSDRRAGATDREGDARGRFLAPEQDRRRDPRDEPSILDLGSVRETDGDHPEGWTDPVAPFAGAGDGPGADDGGDWTEMIAPDLAPEADGGPWQPHPDSRDGRRAAADSVRYGRVMTDEESE